MADNDAVNALRQEIQKVWDRSYHQAKAENRSDEDASTIADAERVEFMKKWGIGEEHLQPAGPKIRHSGPKPKATSSSAGFMGAGLSEQDLHGAPGMAERPKPASLPPQPRNPVDLGSSPLRTSFTAPGTGASSAVKIGDLLKRARENAGRPPGALDVPPGTIPPAATGSLREMVERTKGGSRGEGHAAHPPVEDPFDPPVQVPQHIEIRNVREHRRVQDPLPPQPVASDDEFDPLPPRHEAPMPESSQERDARRQEFLDEFDRTYERVQLELEQRISILDMVDGNHQPTNGRSLGADLGEVERIAGDLDRLVRDLQKMMETCRDLSGRVGVIIERIGADHEVNGR